MHVHGQYCTILTLDVTDAPPNHVRCRARQSTDVPSKSNISRLRPGLLIVLGMSRKRHDICPEYISERSSANGGRGSRYTRPTIDYSGVCCYQNRQPVATAFMEKKKPLRCYSGVYDEAYSGSCHSCKLGHLGGFTTNNEPRKCKSCWDVRDIRYWLCVTTWCSDFFVVLRGKRCRCTDEDLFEASASPTVTISPGLFVRFGDCYFAHDDDEFALGGGDELV